MATPRKRIMIKIGIVDDHAIVRSGLRQFLSEHVDLRVEGEAAMAAKPSISCATMKLTCC